MASKMMAVRNLRSSRQARPSQRRGAIRRPAAGRIAGRTGDGAITGAPFSRAS
jgi:hypothetical protein